MDKNLLAYSFNSLQLHHFFHLKMQILLQERTKIAISTQMGRILVIYSLLLTENR